MKISGKVRLSAAALAATLLVACGGGSKDGDKVETKASEVIENAEGAMEDAVEDTMADAKDAMSEVETADMSSDAQALVDQCVAEGESAEVCGCQINAVEDALGEDHFATLVELAKNDDEAGAEALMTEIMTDDPATAMKMGTAIMGCTG